MPQVSKAKNSYAPILALALTLYLSSMALPAFHFRGEEMAGFGAALFGWMGLWGSALNPGFTAVSWLANLTFFGYLIFHMAKLEPLKLVSGYASLCLAGSFLFAKQYAASSGGCTSFATHMVDLTLGSGYFVWLLSMGLLVLHSRLTKSSAA